MSIANDIIRRQMPNFDHYLRQGESLDDIDEYGFTPLIECVITRQPEIAEKLLARGVEVDKPDVTGRTALFWAVDNNDIPFIKLLLRHNANANAYTSAGMPILVYPVLREQTDVKRLLYQHGARVDFAQDFIQGKLLGHRFELNGSVDIVTAQDRLIELNYEGFILEFTVATVIDALRRFTSSYSTRKIRHQFTVLHAIMDAFEVAAKLLSLQHQPRLIDQHLQDIEQLIAHPLVILPAASRGHAMGFLRYHQFWVKVDRGENSLKEGSVNIYRMSRPQAITVGFIKEFLYNRQPRSFFHERINQTLGLIPVGQLPISSQITGNCSWANIQAIIPAAHALLQLYEEGNFEKEEVMALYHYWQEWDKDRSLDDCIQRFYQANRLRKASLAAMLGGVLFQACNYGNPVHMQRAEKILAILTLQEYNYVLRSYLNHYCVKRLTRRGNNLLKILEDCGVNPDIDVHPVATGLENE